MEMIARKDIKHPRVAAGERFTATPRQARLLKLIGKAVEVEGEAKAVEAEGGSDGELPLQNRGGRGRYKRRDMRAEG